MNVEDAELTVGALLRERRQAQGISLDDISVRIRIRRVYLVALEDDRFDLLPGDGYIAGFLRAYAEALRLPPAPLLARCRQQISNSQVKCDQVAASRSPSPPVQRRSRRRKAGVPAWLTAATLIAAALLFAHFTLGKSKQAQFPVAARVAEPRYPAVLRIVIGQTSTTVAPFSLLIPSARPAATFPGGGETPVIGGAPGEGESPNGGAEVSDLAAKKFSRVVDLFLSGTAVPPVPAVPAGPWSVVVPDPSVNQAEPSPAEGAGSGGRP